MQMQKNKRVTGKICHTEDYLEWSRMNIRSYPKVNPLFQALFSHHIWTIGTVNRGKQGLREEIQAIKKPA